MKMPTKIEKIQALLNGTGHQLIATYFGDKGVNVSQYWKDVTFEEVRKYADEHGVSEDICSREPGTGDGMYLVESGGSWLVYYQERGGKGDIRNYPTQKEAIYGLLAEMGRFFIAGSDEFLKNHKPVTI